MARARGEGRCVPVYIKVYRFAWQAGLAVWHAGRVWRVIVLSGYKGPNPGPILRGLQAWLAGRSGIWAVWKGLV